MLTRILAEYFRLPEQNILQRVDIGFLLALALLISTGLVMVASSSIDFAAHRYGDPWYLFRRQCIFFILGVSLMLLISGIPLRLWQKYSTVCLLLALAALIAVLIPGIGQVVNGSRRWLPLGVVSMQASELAKFCLLVFFASYLARRQQQVTSSWQVFSLMTAIVAVVVALLMAEPDFGSSVVIALTLGAMMFVAGVPILRFLALATLAFAAFAAMAWISPYRWQRLVAFMDPWSYQFDSGYQLVQSLIAFGRGEWFGLGLGNSLQKLFFLPEAHTDFIFAIFAEEFGLIGALLLIGVFVYFIAKILCLAKVAHRLQAGFAAYLCFGIGILLATQTFVNMGVASGLLPTKGLTLPLISYGGSSLLINFALLALVLRAHWELSDEG